MLLLNFVLFFSSFFLIFDFFFLFIFFCYEAEKSLKNLILYCWPNNEDIFPLNNKNMIPFFEHTTQLNQKLSFVLIPTWFTCVLYVWTGRMCCDIHMIWLFNSDFRVFIQTDPKECRFLSVFLSFCIARRIRRTRA